MIVPFLLADAGGLTGGRSLGAELASALGISALGVLAVMVLLPLGCAAAPVGSGVAALSDIGIPPEAIHAERFVDIQRRRRRTSRQRDRLPALSSR